MRACVIIPVYNRANRIVQALNSVRAQTHKDFACLVLDDGSTDGTFGVVSRWIQEHQDGRFVVSTDGKNRGGVAMNEQGMEIAARWIGEVPSYDFWTRLGSDDYWLPHKLALDVAAFEMQPDAGAVFGPYRNLYNEDDVRELAELGLPQDARGALLSRGFAASWANIAVRTSVLRQVGERHHGFCDLRSRNMEDFLVNTRIASFTEFAWRGLVKTIDGERVLISGLGSQLVTQYGWGSELEHDGVWRVAGDGASQNGDICAADAKITMECIAEDAARFTPVPRYSLPYVERRWS